MNFEIPPSLKIEHEKLHEMLRRATKEPGLLGESAKVVANLMHPHFILEEEVAMPPLGLLRYLAQGEIRSDMEAVLSLTDRLKDNLDKMLNEHKSIVSALKRFSEEAKRANKHEYETFSEDLMLHAQTEEEVLYPAAILIGEYIRQQLNK
jgi:hypothetical protein